ncbi:MAG TPA: FHA domain-containing protein [Trebonia sp.]
MATCPSGHESASDDFCDVCGVLIGAPPSLVPGPAPDSEAGPAGSSGTGGTAAGTPAPGPAGTCPRCGAPRTGQFCESCGLDFATAPQSPAAPSASVAPSAPSAPVTIPPETPPVPAAAAGWAAVVTADRAYYDRVQAASGPDAAGILFPAYFPQRRFRLDAAEIRIGRHSTSSGINPEIDLAVPPADPGISRLHAVLLRAPDGSWAVLDPGSANGTAVNGSDIPPGQPVPLRDGDRIHLGAWTELRLVREA